MLLRFMETLMKKFGRKDGTQLSRDSATGRFVVDKLDRKDDSKRTYASQESLKRSVVKVVKQHRPALEWLTDK